MAQHRPTPHPRKADADDLARRIDAVIAAGTSASTRRAYTRDLKYFGAWHELSQGEPLHLPMSIECVMQFILDHTQAMPKAVERELLACSLKTRPGPISVRSIRRYLSSLSVAHLEQGEASPVRDERVKLLLRRAQRARRAERPHQKAAITADILRALLTTCDESLRDVRDRAVLLVGFASGGRRRSELANLQVDDLEKIDEGYLLHIRASKTDQDGQGLDVPVVGDAAVALNKWLLASGLRKGKLFRAVLPDGKLTEGLTGYRISVMIKIRIAKIGLDPADFGAHSLRAGFLTEAARHGAALGDAMALSGHQDREVAHGYYRRQEVSANPAAHLQLDRTCNPKNRHSRG